MRVAVMTMESRARHVFNRDNAAVELFASFVLKLNCRVLDVEMVTQYVIQFHENTGAFGWRDVGNGNVAGERATVRAEAPYVEVVNIYHAIDDFHFRTNLHEIHTPRGALEQNI